MEPIYSPKSAIQSRTVWGAVFAILGTLAPIVLPRFGITELNDQHTVLGLLDQGVALAGGLLALYGRVKASAPISGVVKPPEV